MLPSAALLFTFAVSPPLAAAQTQSGQYVGPATCNASCCHGSSKPIGERIDQTEYVTWFSRDPHRLAWEKLSSVLGRRMGERLGIGDVTQARECLSCHASPATADDRRDVKLADFGVSCEACHGAASGWYGSHFQKGFDVADAVAHGGFVDLKSPAQLAQRCLSCHLGDSNDEQKVVDHRLIAAGHPDLSFETGRFLLATGPHWRQRGAESRAWLQSSALVGELVALREQAKKIGRDVAATAPAASPSSSKSWPEFADFDCASCHHAQPGVAWQGLRDFRLARKRPTPVGRPMFDGARVATAKAIAAAVDAKLASELDRACDELENAAIDPLAARNQVASAAAKVAELADRLVEMLGSHVDASGVNALVDAASGALAHDAERIAAQGEKGARQATLFLQSLHADFDGGSWRLRPDGPAAAIELKLVAPLARHDEFDAADFARRFAAIAGSSASSAEK